jgi:pyruvate decarboxylase
VTPLGKSVVDETSHNFMGLYLGAFTPSRKAKEKIESADLVIHVGRFPSDTNTGGWTQQLDNSTVIALHPQYVSLGKMRWDSVSFVPIVKNLLQEFRSRKPISRQGAWWEPVSAERPFISDSSYF